MARVLLTVNGKLITSPKVGMEYDFYIPDLADPSYLNGRKIIQGVSANQLYTSGVNTVDVISRTIECTLSISRDSSGSYSFSSDGSERRSTPSFDVKYGTYAGYTVIKDDVFPRSLLTSPQL